LLYPHTNMPTKTKQTRTLAGVTTLALMTILIASPHDAAHAQTPAPTSPAADARNSPPTRPQQPAVGLTPAQLLARSKGMRARQRGQLAAAIELLRPVAEAGDPEAQNVMGDLLVTGGPGVISDDVEAAAWFRKAAVQGFPPGQINLGFMLEHGQGVARDEAEASRWYRRAALEGFAAGQHHLARLYQTGKGLPLDLSLAVFWYAKAVNQNFAPAQFAYGLMHRDGIGVAKNPAEALNLFRRAASQGLPEARQILEELSATGSR
jgi:uncharacterized protein